MIEQNVVHRITSSHCHCWSGGSAPYNFNQFENCKRIKIPITVVQRQCDQPPRTTYTMFVNIFEEWACGKIKTRLNFRTMWSSEIDGKIACTPRNVWSARRFLLFRMRTTKKLFLIRCVMHFIHIYWANFLFFSLQDFTRYASFFQLILYYLFFFFFRRNGFRNSFFTCDFVRTV